MKKIFFKEDVCMGCGLCEVYCLVQHSSSKDVIKAYKREYPRPLSRVKVEVDQPSAFAVQCQHCKDPPCVTACLSGAMHIDEETGLVMHDAEKCIGCWTCIMVCPYGAIRMNVTKEKGIVKCDLCPGLDIPACVNSCPNKALVYREVLS
jgi:carbon-monoxide dehydrogenase iron sulfur subunit